jgi:hypothetical protein
MGVSIDIKREGKWVDITPGWRSQMASWLHEIGGDRDVIVLTTADIPALRHRQEVQAEHRDPPFNESDEWTQCFETIIQAIKADGEVLVRMSW